MLTEGPTERESEITSQHFAYLKELVEKGVVILAGRTLNANENTFGITILNAETEEIAREIMNNDPAVREGVMNAELFTYRIALIAENNV
jgi:uncharacterized protein YciI